MNKLAGALLALVVGCGAQAQQTDVPRTDTTAGSAGAQPMAQVSFTFDRPGMAVPRFVLQVNEDGSAHYEAEQVFAAANGGDAPAPQHISRDLALSPATTAQIFSNARALNRFTVKCAAPAKNIADSGRKTLRYTGEGGDGMCEYNYSQDKRVMQLTDLFEGIGFTLDMGRTLEFHHRFDRLGLDAATASLVEAVEAGRAVEIGTIAATLRSIAQDSEVMERVRLRAAKLLERAQPAA